MVNIEKLTQKERDELKTKLLAAEKSTEQRIKDDRKALKELTAEAVESMFEVLGGASTSLSSVKDTVFKNFKELIKSKQELYDTKSDQKSFTFSNQENTRRITLGYRVLDRYDDSVSEGIEMVNTAINALVKDDNSRLLMDLVNLALKKNKDGNLKASRVLDLHNISQSTKIDKLSKDFDIKKFREGISVIMDAYKSEKSAYYIEASSKNAETNQWENVALSISSVAFPEKINPKNN